jgi:hypothetical protein
MTGMFHLRLPASELGKLGPSHPQAPPARSGDVVPELAPAAVAPVETRRRRPVHHLSGFARA